MNGKGDCVGVTGGGVGDLRASNSDTKPSTMNNKSTNDSLCMLRA